MQENRWDEESASFVPVETESDPMNVTFDKLAPEVQNAVMVKFDTCENITVDMVISAQELLQEDMATFDGHIVEALMKMPEVNAMYPELKLHAIGWVKHKCILVLNGPKFRQRCASGKNVAKVNARKPENTRLLLISHAPEPINSTLKIQQEKSARSLLPFIANTSRHGKHWMTNWPTLSGLVMWMPETLTAASIAGQKRSYRQRPRRLEAYLGINAQTA